jgi:hypothetical protein
VQNFSLKLVSSAGVGWPAFSPLAFGLDAISSVPSRPGVGMSGSASGGAGGVGGGGGAG